MLMKAPLISSQRYLNIDLVIKKARRFDVFIVRIFETELRGKKYRILIGGHHNYAAAKLKGCAVTFKGPTKKLLRIIKTMSQTDIETFLINNLTDSDYYFIENGKIVEDLIHPQLKAGIFLDDKNE